MQQQLRHNSRLSNSRGSILLNAIVTTIVIAIISGALLQQSLTTLKTLRLPRVKAVMSGVEGALRHTLLQPTTYQGCDSAVGIAASCAIDPTLITRLRVIVPGCAPGPCGVRIDPVGGVNGFDGAAKTYTGTIVYEGTEIPVKNRTITVNIPEEILVSSTTLVCPAAAPIFAGCDGNGVLVCRTINTTCGPGTFLAGFDTMSLQPNCQPLPVNNLSCAGGNNDYFSGITWAAGAFTAGCTARPLPGTQWPF